MSDNKKPGFFEGLFAGMNIPDAQPDTPRVAEVKAYIDNLELSMEERADIAGWIIGEGFKAIIAPMIEDNSPDE